jgi:hypothetical protein
MRLDKINIHFLYIVGMLLCSGSTSADYIEGIDTTDVNGNGLNSTIYTDIYGGINGQYVFRYRFQFFTGYFNYSFADIKMAPDSGYYSGNVPSTYSCIVKNNITNSFSKIQILKQLKNKRYIFQFGTNTTPNNRMLEKTNYDRSLLYKPNNFNIFGKTNFQDLSFVLIASWDPPLPSNNHLIGYIFYRAKGGIAIDTSAPINLAQWDSMAFTSSTMDTLHNVNVPMLYFNLVAVYTEGKSEFLKGWTRPIPDGVKQNSQSTEKPQNALIIKKTSGGYLVSLPSSSPTNLFQSLTIYNAMGKKIFGFPSSKNNQVFMKTSDQKASEGFYIARLELSDKTSYSRRFILSSQ